MNIIDYEHYIIRTTMEPVIESIVNRIDELEHQISGMHTAISNAVTMFPIILGRIKKTEETYDVILKFIKLQEENEGIGKRTDKLEHGMANLKMGVDSTSDVLKIITKQLTELQKKEKEK